MASVAAADVAHGRTEAASVSRAAWVWLAAWIGVGLALNLAGTWLYQQLWLLSALFLALHGVAGMVLAAVYTLDARGAGRWRISGAWVIALVAFWFGAGALSFAGDRAAFAFLRLDYDRRVAEAAGEGRGLVTFPWRQGIPGGGVAIVHDPTEAITDLSTRQKKYALAEALNGNPGVCRRFAEPHYFMCSFG